MMDFFFYIFVFYIILIRKLKNLNIIKQYLVRNQENFFNYVNYVIYNIKKQIEIYRKGRR